MANRQRGTGSIYKQKGSNNWRVQFRANGKTVNESTGTGNRRKAEAYLREKLAEVTLDTYVPKANQVTVKELVDAKLTSDKVNGSKSLDTTDGRWRLHLQPFLGNLKAIHITTDLLNRYVAHRQAEKAANATINRELAFLRAAFSLGRKSGTVRLSPYFPMLKEDNVRQGFLRDDQYPRLAQACSVEGLWLRGMFEVAQAFGWRKESLQTLRVGQVDFINNSIRLGVTKNGDPVTAKMTTVIRQLLTACCAGKGPDDLVFTRDGQPVVDFRDAWERAATAAGLPGLIFHDLCRTAMRNMHRLGIDESVAMKIAGRKTASIFRRYNIVDEHDLADVARRLDEKQKPDFCERFATVQPKTGFDEEKLRVEVALVQ
jgi:integrase